MNRRPGPVESRRRHIFDLDNQHAAAPLTIVTLSERDRGQSGNGQGITQQQQQQQQRRRRRQHDEDDDDDATFDVTATPRFNSHNVAPGRDLCRLADLAFSAGTLVPAFRPAIGIYVLLLGDAQWRAGGVLFQATPLAQDGSSVILVDRGAVEAGRPVPVTLTPHGSVKVLVEIFNNSLGPPMREAYLIDIRRHVALPPLPDMDRPLVRVTRRFRPIADHELRLVQYDTLILLEAVPEVGYAHGRNMAGQEGWFPLHCVAESAPAVAARNRLELSRPAFDAHMSFFPTPDMLGRTLMLSPTALDRTLFEVPSVDHDKEEGRASATLAQRLHMARATNKSVEAPQFAISAPRRHRPLTTIVLALIQTAVYMSAVVVNGGVAAPNVNPLIGVDLARLQQFGALWPRGVQHGEVYRLVLPCFIPTGMASLTLDALTLLAMAHWLEPYLGWRMILALYMTSSVAGNATASVFTATWLHSGGAAGGLGLVVACAIFHHRRVHVRPGPRRRGAVLLFVVVTAVTFAVGAFPGSSNWANVGGIVAGALMSVWILSPPSVLVPDHTLHAGQLALVLLSLGIAAEVVVFFAVIDTDQAQCDACLQVACYHYRNWCDQHSRLSD